MSRARTWTIAALLLLAAARPGAADDVTVSHALSMYGDLKYGPDFTHFDYANPQAPKGGAVTVSAVGTFDTLNPFILKGVAAAGIAKIFDTLLDASTDEPFSEYGLVAGSVELPADRAWVIFALRPEARFHDGTPITAADVVWTFDALKTKGHPFYRAYYAKVTAAEALDERRVKFTFAPGDNRELPLIVGQLPVLSKAYWSTHDFTKTTLEPPLGSGPYTVAAVDPGRCDHLQARRRLLGRALAGQRRPRQLRRHSVRLLSRHHGGTRGVQGRAVRLPRGERRKELGRCLRRAGGGARLDQEGADSQRSADRHAGLRLQHAPPDVHRSTRAAGAGVCIRLRVDERAPVLRRVHAHQELLLQLGAGVAGTAGSG